MCRTRPTTARDWFKVKNVVLPFTHASKRWGKRGTIYCSANKIILAATDATFDSLSLRARERFLLRTCKFICTSSLLPALELLGEFKSSNNIR